MPSPEVWKPIPGFPGYKASDQGRIGSCFVQEQRKHVAGDEVVRVLRPCYNRGYAYVSPQKDGRGHTTKVAKLVMLAFRGPRPAGLEICHGNNDPDDNRLSNLRYDTHSANLQESMLMGRGLRKLTLEQAEAARVEYAAGGITQADLAGRNKVCQDTISRLVRGDTYQDAGGPIHTPRKHTARRDP